jgi:hypothetical protein
MNMRCVAQTNNAERDMPAMRASHAFVTRMLSENVRENLSQAEQPRAPRKAFSEFPLLRFGDEEVAENLDASD